MLLYSVFHCVEEMKLIEIYCVTSLIRNLLPPSRPLPNGMVATHGGKSSVEEIVM